MTVRALAATFTVLALLPASASASILGYDGTRYGFTGQPGESNSLRIEHYPGAGQIRFDDSYQIFDDGTLPAQCDYVAGDVTYVSCPYAANPFVDTGDMNDEVQGDISADGGPEEIHAGPGDDRLRGGLGDDVLDGGDGDDEFEKGGPDVRGGSDTIVGGDGFDTMNYRGDFGGAGPDPVTVSLDGAANDGPAGQSDNVQVEKVSGGEANDLLIGGPGPDQLFGDAGADEIRGGGGGDFLDGETGGDRVFGEDGDDEVRGGDSSDDFLDGGAGEDKLIADGACFFIGCDPGGEDTIQARDGFKDIVNCGGGIDSAVIDQLDVFDESSGICEDVDRATVGPDGTTPECVSAREAVAKAKRAVAKAKRAVKDADTESEERKAKRKLSRAKRKLKRAEAERAAACANR